MGNNPTNPNPSNRPTGPSDPSPDPKTGDVLMTALEQHGVDVRTLQSDPDFPTALAKLVTLAKKYPAPQ